MAIDGMALNAKELGITLPSHIEYFPFSFYQVFIEFWEPAINELQLTALNATLCGREIDYDNWPGVKSDLLAVIEYVNLVRHSINVDADYILLRIGQVIANIEEGFQISQKLRFDIG